MKPCVFFPHFTVALLRPKPGSHPNKIFLKISREMTKYDLKEYLRLLYGVDAYFIGTYIPTDPSLREYDPYIKKEFKLAYATVKEPFKFPHVDHFFTEEIKKKHNRYDIEQPKEVTHSNGPVISKYLRKDPYSHVTLKYDYPTFNKNNENYRKLTSHKWIDNWFCQ